MAYHVKQEIMITAEEFFRQKIKEQTPFREVITLSQEIITAEQGMRWGYEYAKLYAKEELQDLLDIGCYSEYLPKKISEAIENIDNPCGI